MKSKLYTRTGDSGTTSIIGGKRVPKTSAQIEAYGTLDELNSFTGYLRAQIGDAEISGFLYKIQQQLFSVGGYLASEANSVYRENFLKEINTEMLEEEINCLDSTLPSLRDFVIPGDNPLSALAHICRTICRRTERQILKQKETDKIQPEILAFINRLSDYFFVLARK
ncbi:MAG: cob(I)yrinic acid a,c-diamide adenosyltransferase, partial [Prevotellaceae bacterium]|nr:cob(I)yrinic acid a,c-diamide adenosyltransferase [Prevotellaceae bacterium]